MAVGKAKAQANGIREQQPRCSALTKAGVPCQSFALRDAPYCQAHAGADMAALGQKGGLMAAGNRTVRERLRAAAEENYDAIEASLLEALRAETVQHVTCPNCQHAVPAPVPDARARARLIEIWLNQTHGNPAQTTRIEDERTEREELDDVARARHARIREELARRSAAG